MSTLSQFFGGGIKSVQTGFTSGTAVSIGSGEDLRYRDITISSVNPAKCVVQFEGGMGNSLVEAMMVSGPSGATYAYKVTARLLNATTLRLACVSNTYSTIAGRWTITEFN